MRQIVLANGQTYSCEWCSDKGADTLTMNLSTTASVSALALAFDNPENTEHIELRGGQQTQVYEGYTCLRTLSAGSWKPGTIVIILGRN